MNHKYKICCLCTSWRDYLKLHILLEISATLFITKTSRHRLRMVRVDIMTILLFPCCCQYQFFFDFIILRYSDLTKNLPALLICPSMVCYSCSVYGSDRYFIA